MTTALIVLIVVVIVAADVLANRLNKILVGLASIAVKLDEIAEHRKGQEDQTD